jgi:hypothetical protein
MLETLTLVKKDELILLPAFIYSSMIRKGVSFEDFLDLSKIKDQFSLEDLSLILYLNQNNNLVFQIQNENYLNSFWIKSDLDTFNKVSALLNLYKGDSHLRLSDTTLFEDNQTTFEIKDNHSEVLFVVVYPQMFNSDTISINSKELISSVLKLLYGYNNYDIVARYPLFERYLVLL